MGALLQFVGDGGHALAAALFAALGIFSLRGRDGTVERALLTAALLLTACWALYISFGGVARPLSGLMESLRNGGWLLFMFVVLRRGIRRRQGEMLAICAVYAAIASLLVVQSFLDPFWWQISAPSDLHIMLVRLSLVLRMLTAIGGLLLAHNLYGAVAPVGRTRIALLMGAVAAMWTYDLNLYAIAYAAVDRADELYALRGVMMAMLAPIIALGLQRGDAGQLRLSRAVTFRSLSIVGIGLYVMVLVAVVAMVELIAGSHARLVEIGALFLMALLALLLLPSPRFRARVKVLVAKHFFQHRYDYRLEWLRFGDTIGRPGEAAPPLGVRAVKAVADITESPAGMLLLRDEGERLMVEAQWNWPGSTADISGLDSAAVLGLERADWIVDVDRVRQGETKVPMPEWLTQDQSIWALVPLLHFDRLIGAILLTRPPLDRRLDWEDFDMLRAAGRQVATYISEAQGQQALDDAQRFDEFNRRFAFIIHDVKNLVSQLSLLARNAQRHADNPDFRADMVLTLQESVGRMNDLLARLSQHNKGRAEEPRAVDLGEIARRIMQGWAGQYPVTVTGEAPPALADPVRVEQILVHLVQNAIEASKSAEPVRLELGSAEHSARIAVIDRGCGMTAEFVRRDLFKPFSSSKAGGFGIGAFEARTLAEAMGGRIEVESRPGTGSKFTLILPLVKPAQMMTGRAA
jgi:putative PEP-CTERM system histidine kinase